jgi:micrococcal nuclease
VRWLAFVVLLVACTQDPQHQPQALLSPQTPELVEATASPASNGADTIPSDSHVPARVVRVVDGDTIQAVIEGETTAQGVRYLLIDTPETVDPRVGVQCMGLKASDRNRELVAGETIYLESDVTERDRFGRLLRYVYLADGRMVNEILVREGLAALSTVPPDVKYIESLLAAQREAVEAGRGLWGICGASTIPAGRP